MASMRLLLVPLGILALTVLAAGTAAAAEVDIQGFRFNPASITIEAGESVTWTNLDGAPHSAVATSAGWKTATLSQGQQGTVTFTEPGTYAYFCGVHPSMKGTVVVTAPASETNTSTPSTEPQQNETSTPPEEDVPSDTTPEEQEQQEQQKEESASDPAENEPTQEDAAQETPQGDTDDAAPSDGHDHTHGVPETFDSTPSSEGNAPVTHEEHATPSAAFPLVLAGLLAIALARRRAR